MARIGAHVSSAAGLAGAVDKAEAIGAEAMQIFGSSPRMWRVLVPRDEEVARYRERLARSSVFPVYLHAAYLVNLASPDETIRVKSVANLKGYLTIAERIGAKGLIFHLGSGKESPREEAARNIAEGMKEILRGVQGGTELVMENSAGGGRRVGACPEDFRLIMERVDSPRVKICFDTAHAYEAGMIREFTAPLIRGLFDSWDREVGMEHVVVIHANDSKTAFDSHHDRHENIGEGYIGLEGFRNLAREERLTNKAWILETPGFDELGPDRKNVELLRLCFGERTEKSYPQEGGGDIV